MKARSLFLSALLGLAVIVADSALVLRSTRETITATGDQLGSEGSDVEFILFTTDRDNPSILEICRACEEIYTMSADGSNQTRITSNNFNDSGAVWSHEAKLIAFNTNRVGGYPQIFLMDADGSDQRLLVDAGVNEMGEQIGAGGPSWSPDGSVSVSATGSGQVRSSLLTRAGDGLPT